MSWCRNICNKYLRVEKKVIAKIMSNQESFENSLSSSKGKKLYTRYWFKNGDTSGRTPRALLLILHGLGEHCLWYADMAEFLNTHGVFVFAHDHVGHGQSEGSRVHIDDFQEYVDDGILHAQKIQKDFPHTPMFVLGHSMGGLMSIIAASQQPDLFKGVILDAPLITLDNLPPAFVVKKYEDDPLVYHGKLKCRQVATMLDAMYAAEKSLSEIEWPFLILHGEPDTLTSVNGSKLMFEKAKSKDKQLKLFPDAFHQLHLDLEPVRSETLNLIASWITERAKPVS